MINLCVGEVLAGRVHCAERCSSFVGFGHEFASRAVSEGVTNENLEDVSVCVSECGAAPLGFAKRIGASTHVEERLEVAGVTQHNANEAVLCR